MSDALLNARQQSYYDELLVYAWRKDMKIGWAWSEWLVRFKPEAMLASVRVSSLGRAAVNDAWREAETLLAHLKHYNAVRASMPARRWMAVYLPTISDLLWADKSDAVVLAAMRGMPLDNYDPKRSADRVKSNKPRMARFITSVRDRDRRHDWGTVK